VRQVVELIDPAPETAFTVAGLAVCAGVSERSLHGALTCFAAAARRCRAASLTVTEMGVDTTVSAPPQASA
jgi:hypothetical protein